MELVNTLKGYPVVSVFRKVFGCNSKNTTPRCFPFLFLSVIKHVSASIYDILQTRIK
jgi:hypothetical protein